MIWKKTRDKKGRQDRAWSHSDRCTIRDTAEKAGAAECQITQPEFDLHKNASIVFFETVGLKSNIIKAHINMYI